MDLYFTIPTGHLILNIHLITKGCVLVNKIILELKELCAQLDTFTFITNFGCVKSPFKIPETLDVISVQQQLMDYLKAKFEMYYDTQKEVIDDYLYMKSKLEELEHRIELQYRLTISNSKNSGKVINAKLKLPFVKNKNSTSKYPYFNIHIGKLSDYKLGLEDPLVRIDTENKLKEFIDSRYPFEIINVDYKVVIFKY